MTHRIETVELAKEKHEAGLSNNEAARQVNAELGSRLSVSTINTWVNNRKAHGEFGPLHLKGDNHAIDAHAQFILSLVESQLDIPLEEIRRRLASDRDFHCCVNTVRNFLARHGVAPPLERKRICREQGQEAKALVGSEDDIPDEDYDRAAQVFQEKACGRSAEFGDDRKGNAKKYSVFSILCISMMAVLSGCTTVESIARFAEARHGFLRRLFALPATSPSKWTILRVLKSLDVDAVLEFLFEEVRALSAGMAGALGLDGRIMRGTISKVRGLSGKGIVVACNPATGLVEFIGGYGRGVGEIPALRALVEKIEIAGKWITADAAHLQRATVDLIAGNGGKFLIALKANQEKTMDLLFRMIRDRNGRHDGQCFSVAKGHGRSVTYQARTCIVPRHIAELLNIPHVKMVLEVMSACSEGGFEVRHFVLSEATDVKFAFNLFRNHWMTESNNWEADVTFLEDHHKVLDAKLALMMAGFRRWALNVAKVSDIRDTRRGILQRAAMSNKVLLGLVINYKSNLISHIASIGKFKQVQQV